RHPRRRGELERGSAARRRGDESQDHASNQKAQIALHEYSDTLEAFCQRRAAVRGRSKALQRTGGSAMAHFFKAADAPSTGYDVDNKLAPGSVWRMQVPLFRPGTIALFDGTEDGLLIRSNNPDVVPNDGFGERKDGANRILTLYGQRTGTSLIEVRATKNGPLWSVLQVQVGDVSRAGKQEGGWVKVHRGALRPE